jgi:hypothetical protein
LSLSLSLSLSSAAPTKRTRKFRPSRQSRAVRPQPSARLYAESVPRW